MSQEIILLELKSIFLSFFTRICGGFNFIMGLEVDKACWSDHLQQLCNFLHLGGEVRNDG